MHDIDPHIHMISWAGHGHRRVVHARRAGMIPAGDVADLQSAFRANPNDIGVGLYNPATGEVRLGSFDLVAQGQGAPGAGGRPGHHE